MKSTLGNAAIILFFAALSVCCVRPAEAPASASTSNKRIAPDSGNVEGAQSQEPASDDQLVGLLQEQNKRLKAQVQRLEKENADLKAKL